MLASVEEEQWWLIGQAKGDGRRLVTSQFSVAWTVETQVISVEPGGPPSAQGRAVSCKYDEGENLSTIPPRIYLAGILLQPAQQVKAHGQDCTASQRGKGCHGGHSGGENTTMSSFPTSSTLLGRLARLFSLKIVM